MRTQHDALGKAVLAVLLEKKVALEKEGAEVPLLLALLDRIDYGTGKNPKVTEQMRKEYANALREGIGLWREKERERDTAKLLRKARTEGKAKGKAESLLKILAVRDIAVSRKVRAQIMRCSDEKKLDRWLDRAVAVGSAAELIEVN